MKAAHILSFAFSCLLFAGCTKSNDHPNEERVKVGDPLPYFSVAGADGAIYRSFDLNGKTTLICFFNTTCPDCHREPPKLQYVWEELESGDRFDLVCIGRERTLPEIGAYWRQERFTMPYYEDPDRSVYELFATMTVPRLYLSDETGHFVKIWIENTGLTQEQLLAAIKSYIETP